MRLAAGAGEFSGVEGGDRGVRVDGGHGVPSLMLVLVWMNRLVKSSRWSQDLAMRSSAAASRQ